MKERFGEAAPEEEEQVGGGDPAVPVPEDFPEDRKVTRPPGLSIEEQRAAYDDHRMHRHGDGTLSRPITRHG